MAAGVALVDISATPFLAAAEGVSQLLLLVRLRTVEHLDGENARRLSEFVEQTPDAVAITDSSGRLQSVNPAFLALCAPGTTEHMLRGRGLAEALGDPDRRLAVLVAQVRRNGIAAQVRAPIGVARRGWPQGGTQEVEVSAALLAEGDQECIGFILRRQLPWADAPLQSVDDLVMAVEGLVAQLGRVSLPELMAEASHLAEQHLISAALARAHGHLGTAAGALGVTADSLSQRLRRHGLAADGDAPPLLN